MSQISVYLNPYASKSLHNFQAEEIKKYFFRQEIQFYSPINQEELLNRIAEDRKKGIDCIFSIGGDGTANLIAQNLIGSKTKLLVLAGGTANDFASELGTNSNIKKLANIYHAKTTKEVDILKVNDRYLMTNGGIGIAQTVAEELNKLRKENALFKSLLKGFGKNTYSLLLIKNVLLNKFALKNVFIDSPDFPRLEKRVKSPLILVNNQPRLAGKYPVAPETRNDDGKFNVTIFLHDNKFSFAKSAIQFLQGKYPENDPNIISFETDKLNLTTLDNSDLKFFGDGEVFTPSKEIKVELLPKALNVFTHDSEFSLCSSHSLDIIPRIQ